MTIETKLNPDSALVGQSPLRRCAGNVVAALAALTRPARLHPLHAWMPSPQRFAIATAMCRCGVFAVPGFH